MSYRLLLVDAVGSAVCRPLRLRELRKFPGEGLSVHFRPVRSDLLFESAKVAGRLAYRMLYGEGVVRSQLWVEYEVPGEPVNVMGRSSDLLFALALTTAAWTRGGDSYPVIAATGVVDVDGTVLSVEHPAQKIAAAVGDLATVDTPAIVFYPAADTQVVAAWLAVSVLPPHVQLRPVERVEDALSYLGCALEKVYLRNPFRGLEHFDFEHHSIFFGRDSEVRECVEQLLRREAAGVPGLLVEGPSGSGKSSFLRAGVLPTLVNPRHQPENVQVAIGSRPVSSQVRRAIWRPGLMPTRPDEAGIACSIAECWAPFSELSLDGEASGQRMLAQLAQLRRNRWPTSHRFVWVIDQLEEILPLDLEDSLLETLGQFLLQLQSEGVWILACMRADALPVLKRHEAVRRVFGSNEGQFYLATLSGLALDDVISRPAQAADLTFGLDANGKRLDQWLREEAYREQDSLPLLQFTLNELYLHRSGRELTFAAYQQLGGLAGSIAITAESILKAEVAGSAHAARRLFRNLVSVDETGHATRRYVPWVEVTQEAVLGRLLRQLVAARLCVTDQREGESVVAFAHDSLLRTLPLLIDWLRGEAGLLQTRELAQREARLWQHHQLSDAWLAGSDKLIAFEALTAAEVALSPLVRTFIERSRRHVRRTSRIKQTAVALIAVLAIAASIGAWIATQKQREAEYQTAQARKAQLQLLTEAAAERLKDGDIAYARGVILEVLRHRPSASQPDPAAVNVFQEIRANDPALAILVGHDEPVRRAEYSPDGQQILTAAMDGTARIWDARTGIQLRILADHGGRSVNTAVYSPDGTRIVTASSDQTARIWEASTGRELAVLRDVDRVTCAVYSPDGSQIATLSPKSLRLWDARTGAQLRAFSLPGVSFGTPNGDAGYRGSAAYSPDGQRIVTTMEDRTARIWDVRTGSVLTVLAGHTEYVATAAYSPDGKRIVTSGDNTARIWDAATGQQLLVLAGHERNVWSAVYSPDRTMIATASTDKTIRIWDATSGAQLSVLSGHVDILCAAAFSPDGRHLVTAAWDRTARTWNLRPGANATVLAGHVDQVASVAYSPDGAYLVTTGADKTARLWDSHTHAQLAVLHDDHNTFNSARFSPDGLHIITASDDNSARIWDVQTRMPATVLNGPAPVLSVAYSADGQRIVGTFRNLTFGVWDAHTGVLGEVRLGHRDTVATAVFSPDKKQILTASVDKTVRMWDSKTLSPLTTLSHKDFVNTAVYSADGTRIVSAVDDSTARIWDARTGEQTGVLSGHHSFVYSAAFSPDGSRIVTGSKDKTVRIWDARTGTQLAVLMGHVAKVNEVAYSPDGTRIASASADKTVRIWDAHIPAAFPAQVLWEEAAEADALSGVERTHLGLAPTTALLADTTIQSYAQPTRQANSPRHDTTTACDRQAAAYYDPDRHTQGVEQDRIDPDMAIQACAPLAASDRASAQALYQAGRALVAKVDFLGARNKFERAISLGSRAARIDLALLLTNTEAKMLDPPRAKALYQQAWRQNILFGGFKLGELYEQGISAADHSMAFPRDPTQARLWYQRAAAAGQPHALARLAQWGETAALNALAKDGKATLLLLEAFRQYAQAAKIASAEDWPDRVWRAWRYRRSTLARVLAEEGRMEQVADTYQAVRDHAVP